MKRILVLLILLLIAGGSLEARYHKPFHLKHSYRPDAEVQFNLFYSSLQPYGEWVQCEFGDAWRPINVGYSWRPYVNGRWMWTDYGWYWMSYEPFGWATFHYGRWYYDQYYGWIWIPDRVWGPSWVEWRYDNDYIGWAPLPPYASFNVSLGISFSTRWIAPVHYWSFVPCRYFTTPRVIEYVQPIERTRRIFGNTRAAMNIRATDRRVINAGVDVNFIERQTNGRINRIEVQSTNRDRGEQIIRDTNRERVGAYRPSFNERQADERSAMRNPRSDAPIVRREIDRGSQDAGWGIRQQERSPESSEHRTHGFDRDGGQNSGTGRERNNSRGGYEQNVPPPRHNETGLDVQRRDFERHQEVERRQQPSREQWHDQRQLRSERMGNDRGIERVQPRITEKPQPAERPGGSRGGRDGKRRP